MRLCYFRQKKILADTDTVQKDKRMEEEVKIQDDVSVTDGRILNFQP